ncbi:MAG: hypothetical protein L0H03_18500, partial [Rhodococcus sp. (in: high G+C Gram-positive bacteria)]|nr:hypothetical protein [Rhodococcus sp. (in: high G+C Gram-positive bacteria)]
TGSDNAGYGHKSALKELLESDPRVDSVLDVGVSRTDDGLRGDVAADVNEVAGFVSPNPGGVGPLTRAFLITNVVERAERVLAGV